MCQRPNAVGDVREVSGRQKRVERIGFRLRVVRMFVSAASTRSRRPRAPSPSKPASQIFKREQK